MAYIITALAALFFLGHILNWIFVKTRIPDLLILVIIGYFISNVFSVVDPSLLGKTGDILSTVALVVILYECGVHLSIKDLASSSLPALALSLLSFFSISILVFLFTSYVLMQPHTISLLFSLAIGSTSSAVVIPIVKNLSISSKTKTILSLESAFTDVLTIVSFLVILDSVVSGKFDLSTLLFGIGPKTLISVGIGALLALFWKPLKEVLPDNLFKKPFTNEAFALLSYGVIEVLGYNGAMGVLSLGFVSSNLSFLFKNNEEDEKRDLSVLSQVSFLLKTFFFVYLGMLIQFKNYQVVIFGIFISFLIFLTRYFCVRFVFSDKKFTFLDVFTSTIMGPRGLACAVLATLPVQKGIPGALWIQSNLFSLIPLTIGFSAIFIVFSEMDFVSNLGKKLFKNYPLSFEEEKQEKTEEKSEEGKEEET